MAARQAPKRTAASSGVGASTDRPTQKKTRFVSPSDDHVNFAEEVDSALEPATGRKGRVKTEGYDSDSSDDGEGVVLSRKAKAGAGDEEEEEDMFAMAEKAEEKQADAGGKKKGDFLRLGDIEGQEFNDGEGEGGSGESDGEPEDEDDAERRKKAGMGFELSSFNMREEMEEGKFAADGTFVRSFDPHAMHDRWMDGMDEREIKRARRAKKTQERVERERLREEAQELERTGGKEGMERELVGMLKKGESVLEALARLGAQAKKAKQKDKRKPQNKANPNESSMDVDASAPSSTPAAIPSQIDRITTLASNLMAAGDIDIYSKTHEHLLRSVRAAGTVSPTWTPPSADVQYEYKWAVPAPAGEPAQVFGPFGDADMQAWRDASYFGAAGEKVRVRRVGGEWGAWEDVVE